MKRFFAAAALLGLASNIPVYLHARAMTQFVDGGQRTPPPEELGAPGKIRVLALGVQIPRPTSDQSPADRGLAFDDLRLQTEDGAISGWWIPAQHADRTVVLLHGYAGSSSQMLDIAHGLNALGFNCLAVDFRGSGSSFGTGTTLGIRETAEVVTALNYARQHTSGPVGLYGYSMGGSAALRAIAIEGATPDFAIVENTFSAFRTTVARRFELMGLPGFPLADWLILWGSLQMGENGFAHRPADYADAVTVPTLVLQGSGDARVDSGQATELADRLPNATLVWFEGAGHRQAVRADRARWTATVSAFLDAPSVAPAQLPPAP